LSFQTQSSKAKKSKITKKIKQKKMHFAIDLAKNQIMRVCMKNNIYIYFLY